MKRQTHRHRMQKSGLTRALNLFDVTCLGINSVVGAGIFLLPGQLYGLAGGSSLWVFPLCGILCLTIALCFAEMGGMYNTTGGAYLYTKEALGPFAGFLVGWMMWLSSIIGWASVASGFILYLEYFIPAKSLWLGKIIGSVLILSLSTINYLGVKPGARTVNFFTVGKLVSLAIFIGGGLCLICRNALCVRVGVFPDAWVTEGLFREDFSKAVMVAIYAYTGFEFMVVPAGEMQRPQRDIPRVVFFVMAFVTFFYVVIQFVAIKTFPGLATSDKPLADAARYFMGPAGGILIGMGAILSIGGINAGIALTSPRSLYALSSDGFFPKLFSRIHSDYHTPCWAIVVNTMLTLVLTFTGSFQYLIAASVMVSILQYIPTCLSVILMRKYRPDAERSYKIPGGYGVPVLALIICGWLVCHVEVKIIIATAIAIVLSLPFYFARKSPDNS
ncbi:MAG TPA: APC family permease [Candidatus Brocadiaceae bacterium]